MDKLTWREVADSNKFGWKYSYLPNFVEFLHKETFYKYFLWNGRIYSFDKENYTDTGLTEKDVS